MLKPIATSALPVPLPVEMAPPSCAGSEMVLPLANATATDAPCDTTEDSFVRGIFRHADFSRIRMRHVPQDVQNGHLIFVPIEEEREWDDEDLDDENFANDDVDVPMNAPMWQFTCEGKSYKRLAVPEHPELILGFEIPEGSWSHDIPGDMSKFEFFRMTPSGPVPMDLHSIALEFIGNKTQPSFLGPRIAAVDSAVHRNTKDEPYRVFTVTCETGAKHFLKVYGPFWEPDHLIAHPKFPGLEAAGLMLPTLALFTSAFLGLPFQIATQFDGTYKIMPRAKKGKRDNSSTLADSEGHIYAQSLWDHQKLVATLFHENLGHNTQCDEIYPLLILTSKIDGYEPRDAVDGDGEYAKTNIREFWAVAHEDYMKNPALFHKAWPNVGRLLQSVYTRDGSRFRRIVGSYGQLGFRIRVTA